MTAATKRCGFCRQLLPLDSFARSARARDGRQGRCRRYYAVWYRENAEDAKAAVARRKYHNRQAVRAKLLAYLEDHPCVDCAERDLRCLDFDHRDPSLKRASISRLCGYASWDVIAEEIAKCDVRCSNCHRKRTAEQFGWWSALSATEITIAPGR